jgi:hypothetical protein
VGLNCINELELLGLNYMDLGLNLKLGIQLGISLEC